MIHRPPAVDDEVRYHDGKRDYPARIVHVFDIVRIRCAVIIDGEAKEREAFFSRADQKHVRDSWTWS